MQERSLKQIILNTFGIQPHPTLDTTILLAMKLVSCLLLLSADLALTTADTCCNKFTVSGFTGAAENINGEYNPADAGPGAGYPQNSQGYYFKSNFRKGRYEWEINKDGGMTGWESPDKLEDDKCAEDLGTMEFGKIDFLFGGLEFPYTQVRFEKDPSCSAAPTTTSNPCPSCRNVKTGPMSGLYKHVGSGDTRCTYDGCLFKKDNELYCFEKGLYEVENTCPTNL